MGNKALINLCTIAMAKRLSIKIENNDFCVFVKVASLNDTAVFLEDAGVIFLSHVKIQEVTNRDGRMRVITDNTTFEILV